MTTTMKNAVRYINDDTAMVTKAFMKKASIFGTAEFNTWREYKTLFPNAVMVVKTIKKNPQKKTSTKNMTYENMELYISQQENAKEVLKEFEKQKIMSKVKANPYRAVLAWFMGKYQDVNDYMDFFEQKAKEEEEEEKQAKIRLLEVG